MLKLFFDFPEKVTEAEFQEDFNLLPEWRQKKASSFRFLIDKVLCTKAYLLLKKGLKEGYWKKGDWIEENPEFEYTANGKPFLKNHSEIHFNLSHCKKGVLCVLDDIPLGCDIEEIPSRLDMNLCNYCFCKKEIDRIHKAENPCVEFAKLWTMKEAFLKLTGKGLIDDLRFLLSKETIKNYAFETIVCSEKNYVYTIAKKMIYNEKQTVSEYGI